MTKRPTQREADASEEALAMLITELADLVTKGETPDLETVCRQYPHFESDLRQLWGTLIVTQVAATEQSADQFATMPAVNEGLELPCEFGSYTLESEIGRGGMGVVYRAVRHSDNQPVAIKMILKGDFATLDERNRFDSEALAISKLDHPNIVPIHEMGDYEGRAFFCMKLVEGRPLAERLSRGPIPDHEAARIMCQISQAIDHAHSKGILHRDLKPSNILVDEDGIAYVADFGLAKTVQASMSLTKTGAVLGTPSYMSPEQAAGARGQVGVASDVYSLGAILYHMLTGHPPFLGVSPVDTVMMVIEQDPIAPRVLNRQVDRRLEMISMRCLQKPQDLRYKSAAALATDLDAYLKNDMVSATIGRFGQVVGNVFRETHHAAILENWGLLWMWHSLVLLVASVATQVFFWMGITNRNFYWPMWTFGLATWAVIFWVVRRRMGPVMFVERQIAHVWAASMCAVALLFPLETVLNLDVLSLAPVLGALAGMTFLIKAGILSGSFYIQSVVMFVTAILMAMFPPIAMILFGVASAACFFFSGLKYYRRKKTQSESEFLDRLPAA